MLSRRNSHCGSKRPHSWHASLHRSFSRSRSKSTDRSEKEERGDNFAKKKIDNEGIKNDGGEEGKEAKKGSTWSPLLFSSIPVAVLSGGRDVHGGPVVVVARKCDDNELMHQLQHLFAIPGSSRRSQGFSVLFDTRTGWPWSALRRTLRLLQSHFRSTVNSVILVRSDSFWQRPIVNLHPKFDFEVHVVGVQGLKSKFVDEENLLDTFGGKLQYDHENFVQICQALDNFFMAVDAFLGKVHVLRTSVVMDEQFKGNSYCSSKYRELETMKDVELKNIETQGKNLIQRLALGTRHADLAEYLPSIQRGLEAVQALHASLVDAFQATEIRLTSNILVDELEQKCAKLVKELSLKRKEIVNENFVLLANFGQISENIKKSRNNEKVSGNMELEEKLYKEVESLMERVNELINEGSRLRQELDEGTKKERRILEISQKLRTQCNLLKESSEERRTLVALVKRIEQVILDSEERLKNLSSSCMSPIPNTTIELEQQLMLHDEMHVELEDVGEQVRVLSDELVPRLQGQGVQRGLKIVQNRLEQLEEKVAQAKLMWTDKKARLNRRMAVALFQQDVKHVLDWLRDHGDVFLAKNAGIGNDLASVQRHFSNHKAFENVVKSTYTNAGKLLSAASDLASDKDLEMNNGDSILAVANELEVHVANFADRVEARHKLLDSAIALFTLLDKVQNLASELRSQLSSDSTSRLRDEEVEPRLRRRAQQREQLMQQVQEARKMSKALIKMLEQEAQNTRADCSRSVQNVETRMTQLEEFNKDIQLLNDLSTKALSLRIQIRNFETKFQEMQQDNRSISSLAPKNEYSLDKNSSKSLQFVHEVLSVGQKVLSELRDSGLVLVMADGEEAEQHLQQRLRQLEGEQRRARRHGELRRARAQHRLRLQSLIKETNEVLHRIKSTLNAVTSSVDAADCFTEAQRLREEQERIDADVEQVHASAVLARSKIDSALKPNSDCNNNENDNNDYNNNENDDYVDHDDNNNNLNLMLVELAENMGREWRMLVTAAEERHRRVAAAINFFNCSQQVWSLLETLQHDYGSGSSSLLSKVPEAPSLLSEHHKQKESFLRACTLVRRSAENVLKYQTRSLNAFNASAKEGVKADFKRAEAKIKVLLERLLKQERRVLSAWSSRKSSLEQLEQVHLFKINLDAILAEIKDLDIFNDVDHVSDPMRRSRFRELATRARVLKRNVRALGHNQDSDINKDLTKDQDNNEDKELNAFVKSVVEDVDKNLTEAINKIDSAGLEARSEGNKSENGADTETNKVVSRKQLVMAELLETEASYVSDLTSALKHYLTPLRSSISLRSMESAIFANLESILEFHRDTFSKELQECRQRPEDVGHCFVTWGWKLRSLYVCYCTNKPLSNSSLLSSSANTFFEELRCTSNLEQSVDAYLIKPVQRITKYQLLLKDLLQCCNESKSELREGLDVCLGVPKTANDAMHLSMLNHESNLGELVLQDSFVVVDNRGIIKKARTRRVFLFEMGIVVAKQEEQVYLLKTKLLTSELMGVTEVSENSGDSHKFCISIHGVSNTLANGDTKLTFKASSPEVVREWVRRLRELLEETRFTLPHLSPLSASSSSSISSRTINKEAHVEICANEIKDDKASRSSYSSSSSNSSILELSSHFELLEKIRNHRKYSLHRCRCITSNQMYTVKVIKNRRNNEEALLRELEMLRRLQNHSGIVSCIRDNLFWEQSTNSHLIVLDMSQGTPLLDHLCQISQYSESLLVRLVRQLLSALNHAHRMGVAHLGLRPEIVFVENKCLRLMDFGADGKFDEFGTSEDIEFVAPELLTSKDNLDNSKESSEIGPQADMWSVGVLIYVLLSGVSPFVDDSLEETRQHILHCDFSFPSEHFASISDSATALIKRLLRRSSRWTCSACLEQDAWLSSNSSKLISSDKLELLRNRRSGRLNHVTKRSDSTYFALINQQSLSEPKSFT